MTVTPSSHAGTTPESGDAPFPADVRWSAQDLADAVRLPEPLHSMRFAPSANDALLHRPRRDMSFLPSSPRTRHFRVGG